MVVGYKLYSSPMDCEPGGSVCASRDMRLGAKVSWSKSTEIIESALLSLWNYVRSQYQKIFENNPHIFKCKVTLTRRDLDLVTESLNQAIRLKKQRV